MNFVQMWKENVSRHTRATDANTVSIYLYNLFDETVKIINLGMLPYKNSLCQKRSPLDVLEKAYP